jgi:hypothetical protein
VFTVLHPIFGMAAMDVTRRVSRLPGVISPQGRIRWHSTFFCDKEPSLEEEDS